jgi:hypothetical protein
MSEHVTVDCLHCGDEIVFEVEDWADPPERAYCDDDCYEAKQTPETATATA